MSQHEIVQEEKKYVFGWDQPLMSFFLQVHDTRLDPTRGRSIKVWLGSDPATTMYEVEDLVAEAMAAGIDIPYRLQVELYGEKDDGR